MPTKAAAKPLTPARILNIQIAIVERKITRKELWGQVANTNRLDAEIRALEAMLRRP